jgi:hypothetical protein
MLFKKKKPGHVKRQRLGVRKLLSAQVAKLVSVENSDVRLKRFVRSAHPFTALFSANKYGKKF